MARTTLQVSAMTFGVQTNDLNLEAGCACSISYDSPVLPELQFAGASVKNQSGCMIAICWMGVSKLGMASTVLHHPTVFACNLLFYRALELSGENAPSVGLNLVVIASLRIIAAPGEGFLHMGEG